jgi:hypothetical protein
MASQPLDIRTRVIPDAQPTPDYLSLWRRLLRSPDEELPALADALDTALSHAEPETAGRSPCATETSGRPAPGSSRLPARAQNTTPEPEQGSAGDADG